MTKAPAWTYEHATELRNHWWWRPGWRVGRRFYTWHYTLEDQVELHNLVAKYQNALRDFENLDLIPQQWLHLTAQGLGFVDALQSETVRRVADAVDARLVHLEPTVVRFESFVVRPEAIALVPTPLAPFVDNRLAIRAGIADVLGAGNVPEPVDNLQPHVSIAYVNAEAEPGPIIRALEKVPTKVVEARIPRPHLIELHRDRRMYEWRTLGRPSAI